MDSPATGAIDVEAPSPADDDLNGDDHLDAERDLPLDSDVDRIGAPASPPRPLHLRGRYLAVVAIGGAIGTAAREGLSLVVPPLGSLPLAILLINLSGAFALGVVLEFLVRRGPDTGRRRLARLLVGTGFMGGFTTYSTFAVGAATLLTNGHAAVGVLYALATIVGGAGASFAGIAVSAALHRAGLRRRSGHAGTGAGGRAG